jgi:hypothetical protein
MGHSGGFGCAQWAIAGFVCTVGHSAKPIATAQNYTAIFVKLAKSFEVIVMLKNVCMYINSTYQDLYHPRFKPKVSGKNLKFE